MSLLRKKMKTSVFFVLFLIFILISPAYVSAKRNVLEIERLYTDSLDRTWEDISLLYDNHFHNSSQVQEEIDRFHDLVPELIEMEVIGQTFWGKNITSLCITNEIRTQQKAKTLVVSHHHGREQITVEAALRFIIYLLNSYGVNDTITEFIDTQEIYVIPSLNLDALDIVVDGENYWLRKNVRPHDDDGDLFLDEDPREDVTGDGVVSCFDVYLKTVGEPLYLYTYFEGIDNDSDGLINEDMIGYTDLNRNYDSYWRDGSGWSLDTQSDIFPGHSPFSEPETSAFRDFTLNHSFAMSYSLHSGINTTFFTDKEDGWTEPTLYWNMVLDYRKILPPSFTQIYSGYGAEKSHIQKDSAILAGSWDTWMYFERDCLAPITFEIYHNASSDAPDVNVIVENNATHLIIEFKDIYGYFTPDKEYINNLWYDILPGFDYLLDNTPRLDIYVEEVSAGLMKDDEIFLSFKCTNLSPRIRTIDTVNVFTKEGTFLSVGKQILAGEVKTIDVVFDLPYDLINNSYEVKIGNEYIGYYHFLIKEKTKGVSIGISLSIIGVIIISCLHYFFRKRKK